MLNTIHYYGDLVRKLFLLGGAIMLISIPVYQFFIPVPAYIAILSVLVVSLGAGLIVPTQRWTMVFDLIVSAVATLGFEYYATDAYSKSQISFFTVNQILAIVFFVAFYYAIKTVRGASSGRQAK